MSCPSCECKHGYCGVAFFLPIRQCIRCSSVMPGFFIYLMAGLHYLFTGSEKFKTVSYKNRDEEFNFLSYLVGCKCYLKWVVLRCPKN